MSRFRRLKIEMDMLAVFSIQAPEHSNVILKIVVISVERRIRHSQWIVLGEIIDFWQTHMWAHSKGYPESTVSLARKS